MATDESKTNMVAFPEPEEGQSRFVLHMPAHENTDDVQVELMVGKTMEVDPHNRHFFTGTVDEENIPGWGFTRYVCKSLGVMAGTMMAVFDDVPKVKKFIQVAGPRGFLRYNPRLPLVVYVPEGAEVQVRYWHAGDLEPVPLG